MVQSATVYVVDDDPSILRSLRRLLKSVGFEVQTFTSAQEFLDSKRGGPGLDCLVLDVQMPGINGPELQQELPHLQERLTDHLVATFMKAIVQEETSVILLM